MTAIVGIEHGGRVYLGGDRAISGDDSVVQAARPKVWKRGSVLFGCAGQLDQLQLLSHTYRPPRYRGRDPSSYLGRHLAPSLRSFFAEEKAVGVPWVVDVTLLVGVGGFLFYFDSEFSFSQVGPEWAIGSGGDATRAALMHITGDPRERARRALETASRVCVSVAGPFDVVEL